MPDLSEQYPNQDPGDPDRQLISSVFSASEPKDDKKNKLKRFARERVKKAEEAYLKKHPTEWSRDQWKKYITRGLIGVAAGATVITAGKMMRDFFIRNAKPIQRLAKAAVRSRPKKIDAKSFSELDKRITNSLREGKTYKMSSAEKQIMAKQVAIAEAKGNARV